MTRDGDRTARHLIVRFCAYLSLLALILVGSPARSEEPAAGEWESLWWLDKTARLLRGGEGLGPDDDIAALQKLNQEDVVRRFMSDPRFGDAILDFNMYFLGFKIDNVKIDGAYIDNAFDFPNAVSAAQSMVSGGDYLKLFDLQGPFFMAPLSNEDPEEDPEPEDVGLTPAQMRAKAISEVRTSFKAIIANAKQPAGAYCTKAKALTSRAEDFNDRFYRSFNDPEIFALSRGRALLDPLEALSAIVEEECKPGNEASIDLKRLAAAFERALAQFSKAMKEVESFEPSAYQPQSVAEFRPFDLKAFPSTKTWLAFGYEQGIALANSSTNYNRKRAAYVLSRYLCDDLNSGRRRESEGSCRGLSWLRHLLLCLPLQARPDGRFLPQPMARSFPMRRTPPTSSSTISPMPIAPNMPRSGGHPKVQSATGMSAISAPRAGPSAMTMARMSAIFRASSAMRPKPSAA